MKFIYLLFIIFLLTGCGRPPLNNMESLIIRNIDTYRESNKECIYYLKEQERGSVIKNKGFRSRAYICDSCGKYTVGDTIKIVKK